VGILDEESAWMCFSSMEWMVKRNQVEVENAFVKGKEVQVVRVINSGTALTCSLTVTVGT
jgi:hypothetical protein